MTSVLLGGVLSILCLLTHQVVGIEEECRTISISSSEIGFYFYSLEVPAGVKVTIDSLGASHIKPETKTFIVIDGFLSHLMTPMSQTVTKNLTKIPDSNVILVDWGQFSGSLTYDPEMDAIATAFLYGEVVQNVPAVAQQIVSFLEALKTNKSIQYSQIHVVGHSLGAQIGGAIGLEILKTYNEKLTRISALDPAGPKFQNAILADKRLDKTDAQYVDVYLTNINGFGNSQEGIGHANFYVNGGKQQPECQNKTDVQKGLCNHSFSWEFWNRALEKDIQACPCTWKSLTKTCAVSLCESIVIPGMNLPSSASGNFFVSTE